MLIMVDRYAYSYLTILNWALIEIRTKGGESFKNLSDDFGVCWKCLEFCPFQAKKTRNYFALRSERLANASRKSSVDEALTGSNDEGRCGSKAEMEKGPDQVFLFMQHAQLKGFLSHSPVLPKDF